MNKTKKLAKRKIGAPSPSCRFIDKTRIECLSESEKTLKINKQNVKHIIEYVRNNKNHLNPDFLIEMLEVMK